MTNAIIDQATMTPTERHRQIAAILACGVLRLRQGRPITDFREADKDSKSLPTGLDESAETSPHGVTG